MGRGCRPAGRGRLPCRAAATARIYLAKPCRSAGEAAEAVLRVICDVWPNLLVPSQVIRQAKNELKTQEVRNRNSVYNPRKPFRTAVKGAGA